MTFKPIVVAAVRERELRWRGRVLLPGVFDGEHVFRLDDQGRTCRLHHAERFAGVLVPFLGVGLLEATRRGFEAMNTALKNVVEG